MGNNRKIAKIQIKRTYSNTVTISNHLLLQNQPYLAQKTFLGKGDAKGSCLFPRGDHSKIA